MQHTYVIPQQSHSIAKPANQCALYLIYVYVQVIWLRTGLVLVWIVIVWVGMVLVAMVMVVMELGLVVGYYAQGSVAWITRRCGMQMCGPSRSAALSFPGLMAYSQPPGRCLFIKTPLRGWTQSMPLQPHFLSSAFQFVSTETEKRTCCSLNQRAWRPSLSNTRYGDVSGLIGAYFLLLLYLILYFKGIHLGEEKNRINTIPCCL